jgi:hypothetical protein
MSYIHYDSMSEADSEYEQDAGFDYDPFDGDEWEHGELDGEQQQSASGIGSVDIPKLPESLAERDSNIIGEECKFAAWSMFLRLKASRGLMFPSPAEDALLESFMVGQTAEALTTTSVLDELDGTVFNMEW